MRFTPKSNEEIEKAQAARGPFRPGVYDFEVIDAVEKTSQGGNDMIEIDIKVYGDGGDFKKVRDWLLEKIEYRLRHFAETVGLVSEYEAGELHAFDMIGKSGKVKLGIEKGTGSYPDRNKVTDYAPDENGVKAQKPAAQRQMATASSDGYDDTIPF